MHSAIELILSDIDKGFALSEIMKPSSMKFSIMLLILERSHSGEHVDRANEPDTVLPRSNFCGKCDFNSCQVAVQIALNVHLY